MDITFPRCGNALLSALPDAEWLRWQPHLECVQWSLGAVLCESSVGIEHVYFPTTAVVSILHTLDNGACIEVAVVGREGLVGLAAVLGGAHMPGRAVVHSAGAGLRVAAARLADAVDDSIEVRRLLLRYLQAQMIQTSQLAVCNRLQSVDQHLSLWLLMMLDRLPGDEVVTTHALIAERIGVRRESITLAAVRLQHDGLIRRGRGHIRVLDRLRLEQRAGECYEVVRRAYDRLLPRALTERPLRAAPSRAGQRLHDPCAVFAA